MLQFRETFKQLTPEWHRLIVYSHSSADKKGAFTESLIIYVRSTSKNRVEILYLRISCVIKLNSEMNLGISI